ncbi:uridylate-specific endoribonuclease [Microcaecilia unicolor]|uniref:Protein endoU n=1 Tax=Microcaecilia unicolor TaxID=1415580 RepID=A0A6P7XU25_9AMPH|nr:poly(U)-specific endoribonuclease [Microcaecilia unicolor]
MKFCLLVAALTGITCCVAFETCPSTSCEDSCKNRCGQKFNSASLCQCNDHCERFQDCCKDYHLCRYASDETLESSPKPPSGSSDGRSCGGRCGEKYNKKNPCHCNTKCTKYKNCCDDYKSLCSHKPVTEPNDHSNDRRSCGGRCGEKYNKKNPCHCNTKCTKYKNCCDDYKSLCSHKPVTEANDHSNEIPSGTGISNEEIKIISEKLYSVDHNKAQEKDIILNKQHLTSNTRGENDHCPSPLYTYVNTEIFSKPTYSCFIELLDNYDRKTGTGEAMGPEHLDEQDKFLQEIMKTEVMQELYKFFHQKKKYGNQQEFVADLKKMWFGLYSRSKTEQDSSGFEHIFVGEVKNGKVSGFHSWIRFYFLEKEGLLDYYSHNYDGPWNTYPDVLGKQFHWDGYFKEVGSSFIGSSPEFDFAIYSLCFIAHPNKLCKISLGGHPLSIQTYIWTKTTYDNGKNYIATAYPTF